MDEKVPFFLGIEGGQTAKGGQSCVRWSWLQDLAAEMALWELQRSRTEAPEAPETPEAPDAPATGRD